MKQILLLLMGAALFSCTTKAQRAEKDANAQSYKKTLVAYFSCTGNTERVAKAIAKAVDGKLYRISPAVAYTSADLDWKNDNSRSSVEMNNEKSRPALGGEIFDAKEYDVVFLGYPIWWNLCPRVVNTFIEKYAFNGVKVIPFATSGSSSIDNSAGQLKKLYPKIAWENGRLCNDGTNQAADWAKEIIK